MLICVCVDYNIDRLQQPVRSFAVITQPPFIDDLLSLIACGGTDVRINKDPDLKRSLVGWIKIVFQYVQPALKL